MAKVGTVKMEMLSVSLNSIAPMVPRKAEEKLQLVEDFTKMGCEGLLAEPWMLRSKAMVQEFLQARSNKWEHTI